MSLNKLVGGDCGGNNSLVQLSNIVSRDAALSRAPTLSDQYVNEFMAQNNAHQPQTFNMNSLLNNMPKAEPMRNAQILNPMHGPSSSHMSRPWMPSPSTSFIPQQQMIHNFYMPPPRAHIHPSQIKVQYIEESELTSNDDVRAKAQEYVDQEKDNTDVAYNEFMSFMKKVSAGEMNLGESTEESQRNLTRDEILDEMSEKYKEEWQKLSDVTMVDWESNGIAKEYEFSKGNVMLENKNALEIGKEKLKMGDVPGAVLCFEAAVQQQPESAEAWLLLGTTQTENEQDPMAITALRKSIDLDPRQLEAYITLGAAYANESMPKHALSTLLDWLKASPKYSDLIPQDVDTKSIDLVKLREHVESLYIKAAQLSPNQIDPDVQNALGVVFNVSADYEKAVDCFKTALMVASDNAKLWNRLGATLANSNRCEEAVDAYHTALNLEPGFVRARYNVGITCMNLGAHRQAAEHFLVALNQQFKAENMFPDSVTTETTSPVIWTTLRMVCSYMGEHSVAELVDQKNLAELNKFFEIE